MHFSMTIDYLVNLRPQASQQSNSGGLDYGVQFACEPTWGRLQRIADLLRLLNWAYYITSNTRRLIYGCRKTTIV